MTELTGYRLKGIAIIVGLIVLARACSHREGKYSPPVPDDYSSMSKYKHDKAEYDKHYEDARKDAMAEQANVHP
ncbi:MAG: hypothetical protein JW384_00649 [Nitrosomonadaceae bacterium]|nr:hypothetical protein [Nitrosomonadaceae bacterium]